MSVVGPEDRGFAAVVVAVAGAVVAGAEGDAVAACRFGAIAERDRSSNCMLGTAGCDI